MMTEIWLKDHLVSDNKSFIGQMFFLQEVTNDARFAI